jgi:hypothetical protein
VRAEAGIRQFLDIGTGFPISPNVHEIAAQTAAGARMVYVDNDPMVYSHAQGLLAKAPGAAAVLADLRPARSCARPASSWTWTSPPA